MMMNSTSDRARFRWLLPVITLAIGAGIGWSAKHEPAATKNSDHVNSRSAPRRAPIQRDHSGYKVAKSEIDALIEGNFKRGLGKATMPDIDHERLLASLKQRAGLFGLDRDEGELMSQVFDDWCVKDLEYATQWFLSLKNENDVLLFLPTVIGHMSEQTDVETVVNFIDEHVNSKGRKMRMPNRLQMQMAEMTPADFVRICSAFRRDRGVGGTNYYFPADFAFRETLDALGQTMAQMPEDVGMRYIPTNLLTEWAKHDMNGAWEWVLSGNEIPYNGLGDLISDYGSKALPEEASAYALELMNRAADGSDKDLVPVCTLLTAQPNSTAMESFLSRMEGNHQKNLESLLGAYVKYYREISSPLYLDDDENVLSFYETLMSQMKPDQRIRVLENSIESLWEVDDHPFTVLRRLGHSEEEISRIKASVGSE